MNVAASEIGFFDLFQLASLALFLLVLVSRTVHLRIHKHINAITLSLRNKGLQGVMELALFVEVNLWAMAVLLYALHLDAWPLSLDVQLIDSLAARIVGVILIALATVIHLLALTALGDSWRLGIDERRPGALVTGGIYAISRNPIYLFFDLYFVGTFLINGTLLFLVLALFTIINLHYQTLQEETFLARIHGPAYEAYRAATTRYFTWRRPAHDLQSLEPRQER